MHYSIVTASVPSLFSINYETGAVQLLERPLPRQSPLTLLVRAKDAGHPSSLSRTIQCTVFVDDVNDHAPVFSALPNNEGGTAPAVEFHVAENVPVGHELGRLLAMDEDTGPNGAVHYQLSALPADSKRTDTSLPFSIDEMSGSLKTTTALDREERSEYNFVVSQTFVSSNISNAEAENLKGKVF